MPPVSENLKEKLNKARRALGKKAPFGPDVDESAFIGGVRPDVDRMEDLPGELKEDALGAGVDVSEAGRSGTFFQMDQHVLCSRSLDENLEVLSTTDAAEKYDWLSEYMWEAVSPDADGYTASTALDPTHGYFIRSKRGSKTSFPLQACLFISQDRVIQRVHNIIVAEEDSELHIITGCATSRTVSSGFHIGVSEFFLKKGATITFTMLHNWATEVEVRPRSGIIMEEGSTFISNYIALRPVSSLQLYPTAYLKGPNARVRFQSILYAQEDSFLDVGSRAVLQAPGSKAEIVSRVVARDKARVTARGHLRGDVPDVRGHLECQGLLLSPDASIQAIPELEARAVNVELSHEAAVGKIAEEEILYLMSRGLSADDAAALIVRGFLNVSIEGLPPELEAETKKLLEADLGKFI